MLFRTDYTSYTLPIFDRVRVRARVRFNVQIKYSNSMIFKNSLSASCPVSILGFKCSNKRVAEGKERKHVVHLFKKSLKILCWDKQQKERIARRVYCMNCKRNVYKTARAINHVSTWQAARRPVSNSSTYFLHPAAMSPPCFRAAFHGYHHVIFIVLKNRLPLQRLSAVLSYHTSQRLK